MAHLYDTFIHMGGNIPNPVGCGVLRIGMIKGFFGVGNFGKYFFGWRDLCRDILRYSKQSEDPL